MDKIREIADRADMIVSGYAFTREDCQIRILNQKGCQWRNWLFMMRCQQIPKF